MARGLNVIKAAAWGAAFGPILSIASTVLQGEQVGSTEFAYNFGFFLGAGAAGALLFALVAVLLNYFTRNPASTQSDHHNIDPRESPIGRRSLGVPAYLFGFVFAYLVAAVAMSGLSSHATKEDLRQAMLEGDMSLYWNTLQGELPELFEAVVEDLHERQDELATDEELARAINAHVFDIRLALAEENASSLSDVQRQEIIGSFLDVLVATSDVPEVCSTIIVSGGAELSQDQLAPIVTRLNEIGAITLRNLANAGRGPQLGNAALRPPTDTDYEALVLAAFDYGLTEDGFWAAAEVNASHPEFCEANIAVYRAMLSLGGETGEVLRAEEVNTMLVTATPIGP